MQVDSNSEVLMAYGWFWSNSVWRVKGKQGVAVGASSLTFEMISQTGNHVKVLRQGEIVHYPKYTKYTGEELHAWYRNAAARLALFVRRENGFNRTWSDLGGKELCLHDFGAMVVRNQGGRLKDATWKCTKCGMKRRVKK
jgi:hypothetical protein